MSITANHHLFRLLPAPTQTVGKKRNAADSPSILVLLSRKLLSNRLVLLTYLAMCVFCATCSPALAVLTRACLWLRPTKVGNHKPKNTCAFLMRLALHGVSLCSPKQIWLTQIPWLSRSTVCTIVCVLHFLKPRQLCRSPYTTLQRSTRSATHSATSLHHYHQSPTHTNHASGLIVRLLQRVLAPSSRAHLLVRHSASATNSWCSQPTWRSKFVAFSPMQFHWTSSKQATDALSTSQESTT